MTTAYVPIPDWDESGILPAHDPRNPTSRSRSPYSVSLVTLVTRLGFTVERRRLLAGLLDFRERLHDAGVNRGFQWINGSFVEHVERSSERPPNDIDLVTFYDLPIIDMVRLSAESDLRLFDPRGIKADHNLDAYFVTLNTEAPSDIVKQTTYWYSVWSHDRHGSWKGFLEIDLGATEDGAARRVLDQLIVEGGEP